MGQCAVCGTTTAPRASYCPRHLRVCPCGRGIRGDSRLGYCYACSGKCSDCGCRLPPRGYRCERCRLIRAALVALHQAFPRRRPPDVAERVERYRLLVELGAPLFAA